MVYVNLYNFAKKINSTARPTGNGTHTPCVLKDSRSVSAPVILIDFNTDTAPSYNYCYIPSLSRYYFINDWRYVRGLWEASLTVDVLRSFKAAIGTSSQYVARSASSSDGTIIDSRYPFKTGATMITNTARSGWQTSMNNGFFVVTVAGGNYGTSRYRLTPFSMYQLANALYDDTIYDADPDLTLDKNLLNPIEYIDNIMWFPIVQSLMPSGTAVANIRMGWWDSGVSGIALTGSPVVSWDRSVSVPKHPQHNTVGRWLSGSRASSYMLYYHPYGSIALDPTQLMNVSSLTLTSKVDVISGQGYLLVKAGTAVIRQAPAQVGVSVKVVQNSFDAIGVMTNAMGAVGSLMTGNVAGFANGVRSSLMSMLPQVEQRGSQGSMVGAEESIRLVGTFLPLVNEDLADKGRPLMQIKTINTLSGYIECEDVHIAISNAFAPELAEITAYMKGGFYYE